MGQREKTMVFKWDWILLRSHQCFYTSSTRDIDVNDDLLTLQNKRSKWLMLFSTTNHSIFNL